GRGREWRGMTRLGPEASSTAILVRKWDVWRAGGSCRRRGAAPALGRGGLAGCGDGQGAGVDEVGADGFEGDFVAVAFDGADVAADLGAGVRGLLVVAGAEGGVDGVGGR